MFGVDDGYAYQGNHPEQYVTIEYYDSGSGSLQLQYDAIGEDFADRYRDGGSVALVGTNTWKTHTFHVTDAYFGNRQNSGADFRICGGATGTFYLDIVRVSSVAILWSPRAVIQADPLTGQVPLLVTFDASGSTDPDGVVVGYEWDFDDDGTVDGTESIDSFTYRLAGTSRARLKVTDDSGLTATAMVEIDPFSLVVGDFVPKDGDVDQEDFGYLQGCLVGSGALPAAGCQAADLDGDLDVDQDDVSLFLGCVGGAGNPPGC